MPTSPKYHKQRHKPGPSKNQLKVFRNEQEQQEKANAGTLRERFPEVRDVNLDLRMETATGAVLEKVQRMIQPEEALLLDIPCQGGCGNGLFLLKDAVEAALQTHQDNHEGMGICQAISYADPKLPCNTKLFYRITIRYT